MMKQKLLAFLLAILVLAIDQFSKYQMMEVLSLVDSKTLLPFLDLRFAMNHGVAFSLFSQYGSKTPWFLIGFTGLLSIVIAIMICKSKAHEGLHRLAYAFILGGALGNLIDRIRYSAVIDFIDAHIGPYHWPVFNVADSFICLGAFLLIVLSFREGRSS